MLELAPEAGSDHPEISWGDYFFYYAPDGKIPRNRQPYATIITKNYPDDIQSRLEGAETVAPEHPRRIGTVRRSPGVSPGVY